MALVALTGNGGSTLAGKADVALVYGPIDEVCPLGLAPSTSTTAMIAVGDALAFVPEPHARLHARGFRPLPPGRQPGRKLVKVEAAMRRGVELRLASCEDTVREVFGRARRPRSAHRRG